MSEMRICHLCGTKVPQGAFCLICEDRIRHLPDPATMPLEARLAEFDSYDGPLEVPFSLLHGRLEALLGRGIFTHEFAQWDRLRIELRSGERPTMQQVIDKATETNPDCKVITIEVDDER